MDRTTVLDSAFLHVETSSAALHIASLGIFAGPVPGHQEACAAIARKLPLVPRLRQRLVSVPFALGRPVWVDDPDFDLHQHVRRAAVAAPGDDDALRIVAEQLLSEPLDHDRPLWQDWIIEGLADDRWALLTKVHHTMVDGIAGTDLLGTMLDADDEPEVVENDWWDPQPVPPPWRLFAGAIRDGVSLRVSELGAAPAALASGVASGLRHPQSAVDTLRGAVRGLTGFGRNVRPTAPSSLVGSIGRERGYRWTEVDLDTVLTIHQQLGGTVNDVVLAVVAGAFRELLLRRGEEPAPGSVRTLVPVSVRRPDQRGSYDNRVSAILAELPVELADPYERLIEMSVRMRELKGTHEAQVGEQITEVAAVMPPMPMAAALHLAFRLPHRHLTTVVTNVPGPAQRLRLAGRPLLATYPYVPIADRLRSGIAVTSYDGRLLFGVTTDRGSTPDAHVLVDAITTGFGDLAEIASAGLTTTRST
jgi:diacylglycerol O-acyltransferase